MKTSRGFTLIEAVTAVTVIGIVMAVGVPSFKSMSRNNLLATQVNAFVGLVNYARSEAIKRSARVSICPKGNGATGNVCSADWNNGAIAFVDINGNGLIDVGLDLTGDGIIDPEPILRVSDNITGGNKFTAWRTGTGTAVTLAGYLPSGNSAVTDSAVDFTLCDPTAHAARILRLTVVGQLQTSKNTC